MNHTNMNEACHTWILHVRMSHVTRASHSFICVWSTCNMSHITRAPLTEETILRIFGSPDLPVCLRVFLSAGDSVYSREYLFEILGTPMKMCLICMGTPVKTRCKFRQSGRAAGARALAPEPPRATCSTLEPRGAQRWRALARRRRAPTGSDQSHEDGANRGVLSRDFHDTTPTKPWLRKVAPFLPNPYQSGKSTKPHFFSHFFDLSHKFPKNLFFSHIFELSYKCSSTSG